MANQGDITIMAFTIDEARFKRDIKVQNSVADLAPIWLVDETFKEDEDSLLFGLVYATEGDGWVKARYKYDAFNDVLYSMGSRKLTETEALTVQQADPYVDGDVASQPRNVPAFRAPSV